MNTMMVLTGEGLRSATPAEIAEAAGFYALQALNKAKPIFTSPKATAEYLKALYVGRDYETFTVMFLDNRNQLIECEEMFRGTIDGASVHPREVLNACLWKGAASVVFSHNHPSGIAEPSQADDVITRRLREALALIDVRVLDHIIVGSTGSWVSMAETGML
jgi:DNA repair protein RadC